MAVVISGSGLGLFNASLESQTPFRSSSASLGQAGGSSAVNVATGNLVIQFQDESFSGSGTDLRYSRSYNSLGELNDLDGDGWTWAGEKRAVLKGQANTAGSKVIRTTDDGYEATFNWTGSIYQSSDGSGAHDTITLVGTHLLYEEGSSKNIETYNATTGRIETFRDKAGNGFDYSYDSGKLAVVRDIGSNQTFELSYGSNGKLSLLSTRTASSDALVNEVSYRYDNLNRLAYVDTWLQADPNNDTNFYTTHYSYDGDSLRLAKIEQSDGTQVEYGYININGSYKVNRVIDQSGTTTFTYGDTFTELRNALGETWRYEFDANKRLVKATTPQIDGKSEVTTYEYDLQNNLKQLFNARGHSVQYEYDENGNLLTQSDSSGTTLVHTYRDNLRVASSRLPSPSALNSSSSQNTYFVYDDKRQLRFSINAEGGVNESTYNSFGLIEQSATYINAKFDVSNLQYNSVISLSQMESWSTAQDLSSRQIIKNIYDFRGNLQTQYTYANTDSDGGIWDEGMSIKSFVYDEYGRLLKQLDIAGPSRDTGTIIETYAYDGMGRLLSAFSGNGTSTSVYEQGKTTIRNDASGLTSVHTFDERGRSSGVSVSDGSSNRTARYFYDSVGQLRLQENSSGGRAYTFYNARGRVSFTVDATGAVISHAYDERGKLTKTTAFANTVDTSSWFDGQTVNKNNLSIGGDIRIDNVNDRESRYEYDSIGRLIKTTEEFGFQDRITTLQYDSASRLLVSTTGDRETRFFYDRVGRKVGELNAVGNLSQYKYDAAGQLTSTIRYAGTFESSIAKHELNFESVKNAIANTSTSLVAHYFYDDRGRQIGYVNELGYLVETHFDDANRKTATTVYSRAVYPTPTDTLNSLRAKAGSSVASHTQYDEFGRVIELTSYDNTVSKYIYDSAGRLVREITAEGTSEQRAKNTSYNAYGDVVGRISGNYAASANTSESIINLYGSSFQYDAGGRLASEQNPLGQKQYFFYNKAGQQVYTADASGAVSRYQYNAFGEIIESARGIYGANVSQVTGGDIGLDSNSAVRNASFWSAVKETTTYNKLGLVSVHKDPSLTRSTFYYNSYGERIFQSDSLEMRKFYFDKLGREIGEISAYGSSASAYTLTSYDSFGRVSEQQDAHNNTTKFNYTYGGATISVVDPLGRASSNHFDALGRVKVSQDANGGSTIYTYDDINRTVVTRSSEGITTKTWRNRHGEVSKIQDGNGNISSYSYNRDGQLTQSSDAENGKRSLFYDYAKRLKTSIDKNGTRTIYYYDVANRVIDERVDPHRLNLRTQYRYDFLGRRTLVSEGAGTTEQTDTRYQYDGNGRVIKEIVDVQGLALTKSYTYNAKGNVLTEVWGSLKDQAQRKIAYSYDRLGRMTSKTVDPGGLNIRTQYFYDKNDNRTRVIDPLNASTWYLYNAANEQTHKIDAQGTVTAYEYDKRGLTHFVHTYANRLSDSELTQLSNSNTPQDIVLPLVDNTADRKSYSVFDRDGRVRYVLTAKTGSNWSVTENIYDKNNNVIETRAFDKYIDESRINIIATHSISPHEVTRELKTLNRDIDLGETRITRFAYDKLNRVAYKVDALGYVIGTKYDAVGNVVEQTEYATKPTLGGNYSLANIETNLDHQFGKNRKTQYFYDNANRLIAQWSPTTTIQLANGHFQTGVVKSIISYDSKGQVIRREEGIFRSGGKDFQTYSRVTQYEYDKAGRQTKTILPGFYSAANGRVYKSGGDGLHQRSISVVYDAFGNATDNIVSEDSLRVSTRQTKIYDAANREIYDIDTAGHVSKREYDNLGNVTKLTRYSDTLSTYYGSNHWNESTVSNGLSTTGNRTLTNVYDSLGRKIEVRQSTIWNNFDAKQGEQTNAISPELYWAAPTTKFEYNTFGELSKTRIKINRTQWADSYNFYDRSGRATIQVNAKGHANSTTFNALGDKVRATEHFYGANIVEGAAPNLLSSSRDRILNYSYDLKGQEIETRRDNMNYVYGSGTNWASRTEHNVLVSAYKYDAFGAVVESSDALNNKTRFEYNNIGQITRTHEPTRLTAGTDTNPFFRQVQATPYVDMTYDILGNIVRQSRGSVNGQGLRTETKQTYDHVGNMVSSTDENGALTSYKYDAAGRQIEKSQYVSAFRSTTLRIGFLNSVPRTVPLYSHVTKTEYKYDSLGRKTAELTYNAEGKTKSGTILKYNAFGEVVTEYKAWGNQAFAPNSLNKAIVNSYVYDAAGRVTSKRSADGYTRYYYDLRGQATRVELRGNTNLRSGARVTENVFDSLGRVVETRLPQFQSSESGKAADLKTVTPKITKSYDRWNNTTQETDAAGNTRYYAYDHNNQLISERQPIAKAWRADGSSYNAKVVRTISYDRLGQAVKETHSAYDVNAFERRKSSYQNYNRAGQLTRSIDATNRSTRYTYDINGNRVGTRKGNQAIQKSIFDGTGNITETQLIRETIVKGVRRTPFSVYDAVTLTRNSYDQAGRRYAEYDGANNARYYKFDSRGLITQSINRVGGVNTTSYDALGNKTKETEDHRLLDGSGGDIYDREWRYSLSNYSIGRATRHTVFAKQSAVGSEYYDYRYNNFGQLASEIGGNLKTFLGTKKFRIDYDYHHNGLQKSISESAYSKSILSAFGVSNGKTNVSQFTYNILGNLSNQVDYTQRHNDETPPPVNTGYEISFRSTDYAYDVLGRLSLVTSSQGATGVKANGVSIAGVKIQSLEHLYDEWGNRRAIYSKANSDKNKYWTSTGDWFDYDNAGRVLIENGVVRGDRIDIGLRGIAYSYDSAGRLATESKYHSQENLYEHVEYDPGSTESYYASAEDYFTGTVNPKFGGHTSDGFDRYIGRLTKFSEKRYVYNDLNLVSSISARYKTQRRDERSILTSTSYSAFKITDSFKYDTSNRGFKVEHKTPEAKTQTSYNKEGKTTQIRNYEANGNLRSRTSDFKLDRSGVSHGNTYNYYDFSDLKYRYSNISNGYTTFGNVTGHKLISSGHIRRENFTARQKEAAAYRFSYVTTFSFDAQYSGYKKRVSDVVTNRAHTTNAKSSSSYDTRGRLTLNKRNETSGDYNTYFRHNAQGQILNKVNLKAGASKVNGIQAYYYLNGNPLADFGTDGANTNPVKSIHKGGDTPGSHEVKENDTLFSIAQSTYGDASLWYLLADANGLTLQPSARFEQSDIGRNLTIPNVDKALPNTANSFKVYNPDEIYGDLLPSTVTNIPPPPKKKCNVIAIIVVAIVAVVATVVTAGAAGVAIGATAAGGGTGVFAVGASIVAGSSSLGLLATAGIAAGAAFVGSSVSQLVAIGLDVQGKFSLKDAAIAGLTGGVAAGAGQALSVAKEASRLAKVASFASKVTTNYAANYASNQLFGIDQKFTWQGLLSSAAASAASSLAGNVKNPGNFGTNFAHNLASGSLSQAGKISVDLLYGDNVKDRDWVNITADAFGNALGQAGVDAASYAIKKRLDNINQHLGKLKSQFPNLSDKDAEELARNAHRIDRQTARDLRRGKDFNRQRINDHLLNVFVKDGQNENEVKAMLFELGLDNGPTQQEIDKFMRDGESLGNVTVTASKKALSEQLSSTGELINVVKDPLNYVGSAAKALGEVVENNWYLKYGLTALDIASGPVVYAVRETIMASPLGQKLQGELTKVMTSATEYINEEGKIGNLNASSNVMMGGITAVGLILGGASSLKKIVKSGSDFFKNILPGMNKRADVPSGNSTIQASTPSNPFAYSSAFEMKLNPSDFGRSRSVHFNRANAALDQALESDSRFARMMDNMIPDVKSSVSSVGGRAKPAGWTWEHVSTSRAYGEKGIMRLVPTEQHTPGSKFWRVIHPDKGASGGYSEWAIPNGAPKN